MKLTVAALGLLLGIMAVAPANASMLVSTINTGAYLVSGADPFFWANTEIAATADLSEVAPPASCGVNCVDYSLNSLTLGINGTLYSAIPASGTPFLRVTYGDTADSNFELTGLISVADTYIAQFDLNLGLLPGTLDASSLLAPPTFPTTAIDSIASSFSYGIVAGAPPPPINAVFAISSGLVASAEEVSATPEPAAWWLALGGLAAVVLLGRKNSVVGLRKR